MTLPTPSSPRSVGGRWIPRRSTDKLGVVAFGLLPAPHLPLFGVRRAGKGERERPPQGLRGRVREVEQRARGDHRVARVTPGLEGRQKAGVDWLDLRADEQAAVQQYFTGNLDRAAV